jgi:hypothetical protein
VLRRCACVALVFGYRLSGAADSVVNHVKLNIIIYKGLLSSSIYLDNPRVLDNPKVLGLVLLRILVLLGTHVIVLDNPKS